jgi:RNA polymerase sigma factor (sigma-70 family)
MSKKNKNSRKNTYVVINLITEYGCPLNGCKYAVASPLKEEQLKKEYASELSRYEPFIYMTDKMADPILEANRNTDRWKKMNRRRENFTGYIDGRTNGKNVTYIDVTKDPADILIEREEHEEENQLTTDLRTALENLPESQRRRVIRKYFEGETLHEIADEDEVTFQAVSRSVQRAIRSLRKKLTSGDDNE